MELFTDNLILRTLTRQDLPEVMRMWDDSHALTPEQARQVLDRMEDRHRKNRPGAICHLCLGVFQKDDTRTLLGWCGLDGLAVPGQTVLFYSIARPFRGRGYATQCARALLRYAFEEMEYDRIHGGCAGDNRASYRVMTKAGMGWEGHSEDGGDLFSIARQDWFQQ